MTLSHGSKLVTQGLVFAYDMPELPGVFSKSWRGRPTTNYIWHQNPRLDSSYSSYVATSSGTWPQNHNDAITVYNKANSNISAYYNSGVTDSTNTFHAHWVIDPKLGRPVVIMRNYDGGQWKAKYMSVGKTKADMGLAVGDTYTISWLQWTDNISRSAYVGLYSNNGTSNAFWDGLQYAYNTKVATWQRVYATYTVSNNGTTYATNVYMYGHYGGAGVLKIADVQLEKGGPSTFISENSDATSTRSITTALLDWTGNYRINASNLTFNSDGSFKLNSSNPDYIDLDSDQVIKTTGGWTVESWVKFDTVPGNYDNVNSPGNFIGSDSISYNSWYWSVFNNKLALWNRSPGIWKYGSTTLQANTWYQTVLVSDPSGTSYQMYLNGIAEGGDHTTYSWNASYSGLKVRYIGRGNSTNTRRINGYLPITKIYNRALTASEVKQNFNALRGRYGI